MKDFPRIHSIGTINIIHHQNFDYELHPFRTDFTGDSGVGKSILTDLLQLIIIGSTEYESSTNSKDDRPFNTLVIETSEKGDYGYAYINVEVQKEEYLLIGCYIERKSTQSQAFIVQGGLDFEQKVFEPFQKPFTVEDFVQDETLLTLVDFDAKMNNSDHFGCKVYPFFKDYHEALLHNNLLPLDIASSKSDLSDYAKILQAFSRKGISVKNDVQLQEFLFGKEKNQLYYNKYLETVKKYEDSVAMHRTNKREIETLTDKSNNIERLYKLKKLKDSSLRDFVEIDWNYKKTVLKLSTKTLKKLVCEILDARIAIEELIILKASKLRDTQHKINLLLPELDESNLEFTKLNKRVELINYCNTIKTELRIENNVQLKKVVQDYIEKQKLKIALDKLNTALKAKGLETDFDALNFENGLEPIIVEQNQTLETLKKRLSLADELVKFNDFNNPDTLSHWILKQNKACSPEEESVLRHFHDLKTVIPEFPEKGSKYIPNPKLLISALKDHLHSKENNGFWLELAGLNIYITYVDEQIFNTNDHSKIEVLLSKSNREIKSQIEQITNDISQLKKLQTFLLNDITEIPDALTAWVSRKDGALSEQVKEAVSEIARENLEQIFKDLKNEQELLESHSTSKEKNNNLNTTFRELKTIEDQLPKINIEEIKPLDDTVEELLKDLNISKERQKSKFSFAESLFAVEFHKEYLQQLNILNNRDKLDTLIDDKEDAENRILKIETLYPEWLAEFSKIKVEKIDYENASGQYQKRLEDYSKQFEAMLIAYQLTDKSEQFKDDKNFMDLVRLLLPQQLFKDISFDEAAVIPKIIEYLDQINDANARLNQNKLISIRDLLQDLQSAINKQVSHSKKMNSFFQKDYMIITGDNTASLKPDLRKDISLQWISAFLGNLGNFDFGLFDKENSLTSKLKDAPTLEEKILLAYKEHSISPLPNVSIRQLLNPFSYYTLNYELITKGGKKNSGSTGQTYSSIALLCIAKLSLIKDGKVNKNAGLRFLSIDEAEGIGSNFDMLKELAEKFDYQVISLGINPNKLSRKNQYIYRLSKRKDQDRINHHPSVIFCEL
ncbi:MULTISPECIES: hypothetical protein [Flavobacteriaceae]|uniref:hypothetical protein n=1 Tax=Flavobacteriaceae TaxID=49546 RepID=UPI000C948F17|nr:hypothetical protein [Altibacter sp.]MAP56075.1 hypothetical protein [Altibacter sp.]|tara:strand:- start:39 stop:3251 length:3213 start_codon:yes stop_codon:yes gene_type:complete